MSYSADRQELLALQLEILEEIENVQTRLDKALGVTIATGLTAGAIGTYALSRCFDLSPTSPLIASGVEALFSIGVSAVFSFGVVAGPMIAIIIPLRFANEHRIQGLNQELWNVRDGLNSKRRGFIY